MQFERKREIMDNLLLFVQKERFIMYFGLDKTKGKRKRINHVQLWVRNERTSFNGLLVCCKRKQKTIQRPRCFLCPQPPPHTPPAAVRLIRIPKQFRPLGCPSLAPARPPWRPTPRWLFCLEESLGNSCRSRGRHAEWSTRQMNYGC